MMNAMRLLTVMVLSVLASACADPHAVAPIATGSFTSPTQPASSTTVVAPPGREPNASATAPVGSPTPDPNTSEGQCEIKRAYYLRTSGYALEIDPPSPRPGDSVSLEGRAISPGAYSIEIGVPGTDDTSTVLGEGIANGDGRLSMVFTLPALRQQGCFMVWATTKATGIDIGQYLARPFLIR